MLRGTGLIIQEEAPDISKTGIYYTYVWLKPSTQQFFTMNGAGGWIEAADFPEGVTPQALATAIAALSSVYAGISHTHVIKFDGNLDEQPLTGNLIFEGDFTLIFEKGLLIGFKSP
jgi:hypothetical protein